MIERITLKNAQTQINLMPVLAQNVLQDVFRTSFIKLNKLYC